MRRLCFVIGVGVALSFTACSSRSPGTTARSTTTSRTHTGALGHWSPAASVAAVVDITDARSRDGRLTVAAAGRLSLFGRSGTLVPYARGPHGYFTHTNEPYIARADGRAVAGAGCSFVDDAIYALEPSGTPAVIRVDTRGQARYLARLPAGSPKGIAFDNVGRFGNRLLVTEVAGKHTAVLAIDCTGRITTITSSAPVVEGGIAVAPRSFGAFGGDLIAPDELTGIIWAIDPTGTATRVVRSPLAHGPDTGVESAGFVPKGFTVRWSAYVADRKTPGNPHPGNDAILRLTGADLLAAGVRAGDLVVVSEASADTVVVHCSRSCSVRRIADGPQNAHVEGHVVITNHPWCSASGHAPGPAADLVGYCR
jgi:hypothetical protein